jgi:mevalonate kinase
MNSSYYANGKLLLSGEYFVLDGTKALAIPLKFGQHLDIGFSAGSSEKSLLEWRSLDEKNQVWFFASFSNNDFSISETSASEVAERLRSILLISRQLNPGFLQPGNEIETFRAITRLTFNKNWGLGTSSTLISLIARWAGIDPYELQFRTFGGSGYDIACATAEGPIIYQLVDGKPLVSSCNFNPEFSEQLFFIYLGNKQNSREGIRKYRELSISKTNFIVQINSLTNAMISATTLAEFEFCLRQHEELVSEAIGLKKVKDLLFEDYWGEIKSLGAWGGDFVLATSQESEAETWKYFNDKGYNVFFTFKELQRQPKR